MREFLRFGGRLLVLAVVVAGCTTTEGTPSTETSDSERSTATALPTTTTESQITTSAPATTTSIVRRDRYERSCASRISHGYGPRPIPTLHVGPVAFLALDFEETARERDFTYDPESGYVGRKYVTVVDRNAVGPVTLTIDETSRESAGLVYDATRSGRFTIDGSDHTVIFEVCRTLDAQFNGGFIVAEPMCLQITVTDGEATAEEEIAQSWSASIPFGVSPETCTE